MNLPPSATSARMHLPAWLAIALLATVYLCTGIMHDPWRGNDVQHIDIVANFFGQNGTWLVPQLAGKPALPGHGPLWYWVSALFTLLLGDWLPFHDAARFAGAFFVAAALFHLARAARALYGEACHTPAALLLLGTLGLVLPAHMANPVTALIAAFALALHGLARLPHRPVTAGLQTALGGVLLFLADGLPALLLVLPLIPLLTLCSPTCRGFRTSAAGLLALVLIVLAVAVWCSLLYLYHPKVLPLWQESNLQLFPTLWSVGHFLPDWLALAGWSLWPLWPLACWTLVHNRPTLAVASLLPRAALLLALGYALLSGGGNDPALPALMPPLVLLAAAGVPQLRRGAANAFDWFGTMSFTVFAILLVLLWSAANFDWPPGLARSIARLVPEYQTDTDLYPLLPATLLFALWLSILRRLPKGVLRGPANWALGVTLMWLLAATLLLNLFDTHRNYRPMADSLTATLRPLPSGCIAFTNSTPSLIGAFDYFAALHTTPLDPGDSTGCRYLLTRNARHPEHLAPEWREIWSYQFNGGRTLEHFRLYQHR